MVLRKPSGLPELKLCIDMYADTFDKDFLPVCTNWVHKKRGKELYKTCLEMGRLFDPYKQSSSFTKIVKGQMKSIYGWTSKEEVKHGGN